MIRAIQPYLISALLLGASLLSGQSAKENAQGVQQLKQRIQILEDQKGNLEKQSELLKLDYDSKIKEFETRFGSFKLEVEQENSFISWLLIALAIGVVGFFLYSFSYFKKFIKDQAELQASKMVEKKVATIVQDKREQLISLIRSQEVETRLKNNSKLLVLAETEEDGDYLVNFFEQAGIHNIDFRYSDEFQEISKTYDLIIFDDHRGTNLRHPLFREYIDRLSDTNMLYIFFGKYFEVEKREMVNYANSKFTLYNQIINSLKFKSLLT